jgi:hypothetical protein
VAGTEHVEDQDQSEKPHQAAWGTPLETHKRSIPRTGLGPSRSQRRTRRPSPVRLSPSHGKAHDAGTCSSPATGITSVAASHPLCAGRVTVAVGCRSGMQRLRSTKRWRAR